MKIFEPYYGDTGDLVSDNNYLVFRFPDDGCQILFSVSRIGDAATCHLSSDKAGLKKLRGAINEFVEFVFYLFYWCKMVICVLSRASVERVLSKVGFSKIFSIDQSRVWARRK
jgi:hypothetical protein